MSKLKKIQKKYGILNESYSWERQEGKPLPTLADVKAKYNAKNLSEQGDMPPSDRLGPGGSYEKTLEKTRQSADLSIGESLQISHQEFKEKTGGYDVAQLLSNLIAEVPKYLVKAKNDNNLKKTLKVLSTLAGNVQTELQKINEYIIELNLTSGSSDNENDEDEYDKLMGN